MGAFVEPEEVAGFAQSDLDRYTCELLIQGTEAAARRAVGWNITEETVVDEKVEPVGSFIFLPTRWLTAVAGITVNGTSLVDGTTFRWNQAGVIELASCPTRWAWGTTGYLASYTHGYPDGHQALDDVKDIIGSAVARRIGNPDVLSALRVGGVEETYATGPQLPSIALTQIEKIELREAVGLGPAIA